MRLSKSSFIRGVQCEKMLYLDKHHSDLREESSVSKEAIFEQGTNVGLLAQDLFKGGYDASPDDYSRISKSLINTKKAIENGEKSSQKIINMVKCMINEKKTSKKRII